MILADSLCVHVLWSFSPGTPCEVAPRLFISQYPDEEGWHKWIAANGGMSNAFTAAEETRYFFEVKASQLEEALDRFAGFFTSPLLKEDGAARELLAVDSEHAKNKQSDMWREMQLDRSTSDPKHVHNRFATGDSKTLRDLPVQEGVDVRKALLEYHQRNYHAGRMYAVVVGTEPTDRLLEMASRLFEAVKKEGEDKTVYPSDPYGPERTGIVQYMLPLQETRRLNLKWALPPAKKHWRSKPLSLLSHLIGHETKGSVANFLREKGWSVGLMCGQLDSAESLSSFGVIIDVRLARRSKRVDPMLFMRVEWRPSACYLRISCQFHPFIAVVGGRLSALEGVRRCSLRLRANAAPRGSPEVGLRRGGRRERDAGQVQVEAGRVQLRRKPCRQAQVLSAGEVRDSRHPPVRVGPGHVH